MDFAFFLAATVSSSFNPPRASLTWPKFLNGTRLRYGGFTGLESMRETKRTSFDGCEVSRKSLVLCAYRSSWSALFVKGS